MDPVTAVRSGLVGQDDLGFRGAARLANDAGQRRKRLAVMQTRAAQRGVEVCR